jgi:phosphatidylglycerol:prolipoprotein diacylglycerol transferase
MKQVLFRIPGLGVPVYGFGAFVVLAALAGTLLAARRARKEGLNPDFIYDTAVWIMLGSLIGARLFYVAEYWGESVMSVSQILRVWEGGIVLYGAVIGGAFALVLCRLFRPFPVAATFDVLAPSVALGVAIGRVGCFLNGC